MKRTVFLSVLCAWISHAAAQPVPAVQSATPVVLRAGEVTEVTFTGDNIADAHKAIVSDGEGVQVRLIPTTQPSKARQVKAKVTVSPDAPRGPIALRLATTHGVSKPLSLFVDDFAQVTEKEPNNSPGAPQAIKLPGVIVGAINRPMEQDHYRFDARKGQRLIFDVHAQRTGSKLDSTLWLLNAAGSILAHNEDAGGLDSLIDVVIPEDGQYILKIQDMRYQGGTGFGYRIRAGEIPYLDSIFPLGGRRGGELFVELIGRNLPLSRLDLALDDKSRLGRRDIAVSTSNSRVFEVSDLPEILEAEPNNGAAYATPVAMPVIVNGRIRREGDQDCYTVRVATDRPIIFEIAAARFGSPLDALLTLRDADGKVLQHNDDAAGADARIELRDAKDRQYTISVTDLVGRGGDDFAYRLKITEQPAPAPDFSVVFPPETPRVSRMGNEKVWCEIRRTGGFAGDVTVSLEGLPPGVTCEPVTFSAREPNSGILVLSATAAARPGVYPVRAVAKATIGDREVTKTARPDESIGSDGASMLLTILDTPLFIIDRIGPAAGDEDPEHVKHQIATLEARLNTMSPELEAGLARWEAALAPDSWQPLEFVSAAGRQREEIKLQPDGSLRVTGPNPNTTLYTIQLKTRQKNIRAFKLEALLDGKGPGRAEDGNFVLSHFSVTAAPASNPGAAKKLELANPRADFSQSGFEVGMALQTGTGRGWAVSPRTSESHWALWDVKDAVGFDEETLYTFTFHHDYSPRFGLARFRILASSADKPEGNLSLPTNLLAALAVEKAKRTGDQKEAIAAYYRTIAPELNDVRQRLAELRTFERAAYPPNTTPGGSTGLAVRLSRLNGFEAPVTLTVEGYTAGLDPRTREPNPIAQSFQTAPVTLKPGQRHARLDLRALPNIQKGSRTILVKAEANIAGVPWTQYSEPITITVADPPAPMAKNGEKK